MTDVLKNLIESESGQGMVEYCLVLGLITAGAMALILTTRYSIEDLFYEVTTRLSDRISNFPIN